MCLGVGGEIDSEAVDGLGICFAFLLCVLRVETGYMLPRSLFVCFGFIFIICLIEYFGNAPNLLSKNCCLFLF